MPTTCFTFREILTANRTYYVATTGSDSNNGLSSGSPFLTIQKAIDVACTEIDLNVYDVTISVANGTYSTTNSFKGLTSGVNLKPYLGTGKILLQGNTSTPSNVVISTTSANAIAGVEFGYYEIKGFKVTTTTSGDGLNISNATVYFESMDFGSCARNQIYAARNSMVNATGNYSISGGAQCHAQSNFGYLNVFSKTITFSNSPTFSIATVVALYSGLLYFGGCTFTNGNTVTGQRYSVYLNGVIDTNGGGTNYIPGNSAGSTASGGQYN